MLSKYSFRPSNWLQAGIVFLSLFILCQVVTGLPEAYAVEITYDRGERRDPFIPLIGPDGIMTKLRSSTDVIIEGIIIDSSGEALAVINGELLRAGDPLGEANIIEILRDRIILIQDDEEKVIWLREEIIEDAS